MNSMANPEPVHVPGWIRYRYKAEEVFALYHERWEIELAYGEMKTDMLRQAMTLRSQQPQGVSRSCGPPC